MYIRNINTVRVPSLSQDWSNTLVELQISSTILEREMIKSLCICKVKELDIEGTISNFVIDHALENAFKDFDAIKIKIDELKKRGIKEYILKNKIPMLSTCNYIVRMELSQFKFLQQTLQYHNFGCEVFEKYFHYKTIPEINSYVDPILKNSPLHEQKRINEFNFDLKENEFEHTSIYKEGYCSYSENFDYVNMSSEFSMFQYCNAKNIRDCIIKSPFFKMIREGYTTYMTMDTKILCNISCGYTSLAKCLDRRDLHTWGTFYSLLDTASTGTN